MPRTRSEYTQSFCFLGGCVFTDIHTVYVFYSIHILIYNNEFGYFMSEHVNSYFCKCAWVFLVVHVYICIHTYLLHSALYTYDMYVYIYICTCLFTVKPASWQPSAKKPLMNDVNSRSSTGALRKYRLPDHGPKMGATNLEARLLVSELRSLFWVRNLALVLWVVRH
jgi:hypothetical protein